MVYSIGRDFYIVPVLMQVKHYLLNYLPVFSTF
jgi:hypothetical protein